MAASAKRTKKDKSTGSLRRVPAQARSRKRFEAILDAAAAIFADVGFEVATMDAIATRAQTSIGSLYQFFPDKLSIFRAIADRNADRTRVVFDQFFDANGVRRPWPELVDTAIDAFAELQKIDPDFRALWKNFHLYGVYAKEEAALLKDFVSGVEKALLPYTPQITKSARKLVATMVVEVTSGVLIVVARNRADAGYRILEETKKMVRRYLELYITDDAPPATPVVKPQRKKSKV